MITLHWSMLYRNGVSIISTRVSKTILFTLYIRTKCWIFLQWQSRSIPKLWQCAFFLYTVWPEVHLCGCGPTGGQFEQTRSDREHYLSVRYTLGSKGKALPLSSPGSRFGCAAGVIYRGGAVLLYWPSSKGWHKIFCPPIMRDRRGQGRKKGAESQSLCQRIAGGMA